MVKLWRDSISGDVLSKQLKWVVVIACVLPIVIGCLTLLGWTFGIAVLKSVIPGMKAMNPAAALCFVLCGISLWLQRTAQPARQYLIISRACGIIIAATGLLIFCNYLWGCPTDIDRLLFHAKLGTNRMSLNSALNFSLLGLSLLLIDVKSQRGFYLTQYLSLSAEVIALLALIGYVYGITPLYHIPKLIAISLNSTLAFIIFSLGILLARPAYGIITVVASDTAGGAMARRLLPAAVIIPILLGWMRLSAEHANLMTNELGTPLLALALIITVTLVILWNAHMLNITDLKKRALESQLQERAEELQQMNQSLLVEIDERKRKEETIRRQTEEIFELSTPVLQVWNGIVMAPLIGTLDSQRTQLFMERLLQTIVDTDSPIALVDITGVPMIDTQTAQHLIDTINAVKLIGARVILTGVRPAIAQALVHIGIDLSEITTRSSMAAGLRYALQQQGLDVLPQPG